MSKKAENRLYNAERKAQAELIKRDLDRDKLITQLYQESYDRLQAQIDKFYLGYAGREGLTKQEAMKRASEFDVTKFAEKARKAVKEKDFSHKTNSWLRVYNLKMKVSRLELLKAELGLEINSLTSNLEEVFDKARRSEYLAEFKRQAGILGISSKGANKRLESILNADFYGQNFSSRVWGKTGLQPLLQRDVFASLNRIYTDMNGYQKEMKRLAERYNTSESSAKRLLKTEIARINADTDHAMLKDNGFTHMIFVAEPGACNICGPLDNKAVPIDKVEKGVNMFPMHPNCRCSAYGHIEMKYKDGRSTLDEFNSWSEKEDDIILQQTRETNKRSPSAKANTGEEQKLLPFEDDEVFEAQDSDDIDAFFNKQKSYQKWYNGLDEQQKDAIFNYTMSPHEQINSVMRQGYEKYRKNSLMEIEASEIPYVERYLQENLELSKKLETVFGSYKTEESFITYRGTTAEQSYFNNLIVGETTVIDKAFMSTSLAKGEALNFSNDGIGERYLFDITVRKGSKSGVYISELSDMPEEKEFLIKPSAKFKVISVDKNSSGLNLISLELQDD
jgi:putative head morphogenesis protein|nr:MAG TPA: minor capsid protein [Caudoviricetes sp.]